MNYLKYFILLYLSILLFISCDAKRDETTVLLRTSHGDIKVKLYDDTPLHKENFRSQLSQGAFSNISFHRIIKDFMIQAGVVKSDSLKKGIPSELSNNYPHHFHKRGALGASKWGDDRNPDRLSDPLQFYIVTGERFIDKRLEDIENDRFLQLKKTIFDSLQVQFTDTIKEIYRKQGEEGLFLFGNILSAQTGDIAEHRANEMKYTQEQKEVYKTIGGAPHLDNIYTVFGEVVEGMDVVDKIQNIRVDELNQPLKRVEIKMIIVE